MPGLSRAVLCSALFFSGLAFSARAQDSTVVDGGSGLSLTRSWTLDARYIRQSADFTNLRPTTAFLDPMRNSFRGTGIVAFGIRSSASSFNSQLRFTALTLDGAETMSLSVDEAYAETGIGEFGFAYAGRKHVSQGRALGVSIVDLFNTDTEFDRTLNIDRRARDIQGVDLIGADIFVGDSAALSAVYAPSFETFNPDHDDRYQLSGTYNFFDQNLDIFAAAFYENVPTLALGFSKGIGDAWILYGEGTAREGRARIVPKPSNVALGTFTDGADADQWYGAALLGFGYTTPNGLSINMEYLYNGDGYSSDEWNEVTNLVNINNANLGTLDGLAFGNLAALGAVYEGQVNRRHYAFIRVSHPSLFDIEDLSGELTLLHELDDNSGNISGRVEHELSDSAIMGLNLSTFYGGPDTVFGLIGENFTGGLYVTKTF